MVNRALGGDLPEYLASQAWCACSELMDATPQVEYPPQPVEVHKTALVLALVAFVQTEHQDHNNGFVGCSIPPGELSVYETECKTKMADAGGLVV